MIEKPAFAKINLGLHVLDRRPDGFHNIETVMIRIRWADRIRAALAPPGAISLECDDPDLPSDETNTCMVAARTLARAYDVGEGVALQLEKNVPYGSGLGSGSSDAATVLLMLRELWNLDCSDAELEDLAGNIGSDTPFFVRGTPAHATGRGTDLQALTCTAGVHYVLPFSVAVAVPPLRVSTAAAYAAVTPPGGARVDLRALVCSNDVGRWRAELVNDFETSIHAVHPSLQPILEHFRESAAVYASLSGSGSAVYGLFESEVEARLALSGAALTGCRTWCGPSV